jgi:hypothetical protein
MKWMFVASCCFLSLLSVTACVADDEFPPLKIQGLKAKYSLNETVTITVTNLTPHTLTYGIGVLNQANGKWEECLTNIEDRELGGKAFRLRKLGGNKSQDLTWNPKGLDEPSLLTRGKYRFYLAFSLGESDKVGFESELSKNIGSEVGQHTKSLTFSDIFELR